MHSSHREIIQRAGGARKLSLRLLGLVKPATIKTWAVRNRIPVEYWQALVNSGVCSADELMAAAARSLAA